MCKILRHIRCSGHPAGFIVRGRVEYAANQTALWMNVQQDKRRKRKLDLHLLAAAVHSGVRIQYAVSVSLAPEEDSIAATHGQF